MEKSPYEKPDMNYINEGKLCTGAFLLVTGAKILSYGHPLGLVVGLAGAYLGARGWTELQKSESELEKKLDDE